uniref:ZP domain-containing protein n=1 Tax=Caenorhabditis tropicalis TaxID=1561998 RepID=A0A1I7US23_9PELO
MASYFKILDVTYKCEKECPCRPENKLSSSLATEKPNILPTQKKVRFTVVPVTESASYISGSPIRSGWF